jgi:hypothetical protein
MKASSGRSRAFTCGSGGEGAPGDVDVYERYRMPIVKLLNAEVFIAAVLSTD